jgi:hypothetical protein
MKRRLLTAGVLCAVALSAGDKWLTAKIIDMHVDAEVPVYLIQTSDNQFTVKEEPVVSLAERLATVAVGGMTGWTNAAGRTRPMDPPKAPTAHSQNCQFVVGGSVPYIRKGTQLVLKDARGKKCTLEIVQQQPAGFYRP